MLARFWLILSLVIVLGRSAVADPTVLKVGLHDDPPLVIKSSTGQWSGLSVELLRMIATKLGMTLELQDLEPAAITTGALPDVDLVATLIVTEKMNARFELSHGFITSGVAIAVREPKKESGWDMAKRIMSGGFVLIVAGVFVLLTIVGLLMWWFERKPIEPLPKDKAALSKALFWAFEPVIGYKASQHTSRAGRILGTVWGLFGVVLVSGLTANLAAQLTARRLATTVKGVDDLARVRVGVVEHTAGRKFCDRRGIKRIEFTTLEDALVALDGDKLDAVVDDQTSLGYSLARGHEHVIRLPGTFASHIDAFGLRPGSALRGPFNAALIEATSSDAWTSTVATYLGKAD